MNHDLAVPLAVPLFGKIRLTIGRSTMAEKQDDALTKRSLLDRERLRKRFFGDASKRTKPQSTEAQSAIQQTATTHQKATNDGVTEDNPTEESNDELLERLAAEELLQEAARGKTRAEIAGPSAWKKRKLKPNLRFMANSVLQTEAQNRRRTKQLKKDAEFT